MPTVRDRWNLNTDCYNYYNEENKFQHKVPKLRDRANLAKIDTDFTFCCQQRMGKELQWNLLDILTSEQRQQPLQVLRVADGKWNRNQNLSRKNLLVVPVPIETLNRDQWGIWNNLPKTSQRKTRGAWRREDIPPRIQGNERTKRGVWDLQYPRPRREGWTGIGIDYNHILQN